MVNEIMAFKVWCLEVFQMQDIGRWESEFQALLFQSEPLQVYLFYMLGFLLRFI